MYNFNFILLAVDIGILVMPFLVAEFGFPQASYFFAGFAVIWVIKNFQTKKVNLKRYKLFEEQWVWNILK